MNETCSTVLVQYPSSSSLMHPQMGFFASPDTPQMGFFTLPNAPPPLPSCTLNKLLRPLGHAQNDFLLPPRRAPNDFLRPRRRPANGFFLACPYIPQISCFAHLDTAQRGFSARPDPP